MKLETIATLGILLALLWIGYELHCLNSGGLTVGGMIDTGSVSISGDVEVSGKLDSTVEGKGMMGMPVDIRNR